MSDCKQSFQNFLKGQNLSESSVVASENNIKVFYDFCDKNSINIENLTKQNIEAFIADIKNHFKNNTQLGIAQSLKKFLVFIKKDELVDILKQVKRNYSEQKDKQLTLDRDSFYILLNGLDELVQKEPRNENRIRNVLLIKLIIVCKNFNNKEIVSLKFSDFEIDSDRCIISFGAKKEIFKYSFIKNELSFLEQTQQELSDYVFVDKIYSPLEHKKVQHIIKRVLSPIGFENITASLLRKTFFIDNNIYI